MRRASSYARVGPVLAAGLLWLVAGGTPASAQCILCGDSAAPAQSPDRQTSGDRPLASADAPPVRPLRMTITANLDFARLTSGDAGGELSVDPSGTVVPRGRVRALGGMAFAGRAEVEGEPGRAIRVDLPSIVELTSVSGGTVRVRNLRTDLAPGARLGADGRLSFAFGGDLDVRGDVDGQFRGRIAITVDYE